MKLSGILAVLHPFPTKPQERSFRVARRFWKRNGVRHKTPQFARAEKTGASLVGLTIRDETTGLGGRALITLGKRDLSLPLPWTRLNTGSPILLSEEKTDEGNSVRGLVSRRDRQTIEVALAYSPETEAERPTWRIDLATDEVARDRQRQGQHQ